MSAALWALLAREGLYIGLLRWPRASTWMWTESMTKDVLVLITEHIVTEIVQNYIQSADKNNNVQLLHNYVTHVHT